MKTSYFFYLHEQAPVLTGAGADVTGFDAIKAVATAANVPLGNEEIIAVYLEALSAPASTLQKMHADRAPYVPAKYDEALSAVIDGLAKVESVIERSGGGSETSLTLAEICLTATLHPLFAKALGPDARKKRPKDDGSVRARREPR